jgi:hypothetical protein
MRHSDSKLWLALTAGSLALTLPTQAQVFAGFISGRGTEAIRLKALTSVYYYSSSGSLRDTDYFESPPDIEINDIGGQYHASESSLATPVSTLAKDYGSSLVRFTYTNGGPLNSDSLRIQLDLHGSAELAFVGTPPKPASLAVSASISYVLLGEPDGGRFRLTLPAVPSLADPAHEFLSTELSGGGMSPLQRAPGSAATTVELDGTKTYVFEIGYTVNVPFGTDPDYSYDFAGGTLEATPVPELAGFAPLTALALAGWGLWQRRRR